MSLGNLKVSVIFPFRPNGDLNRINNLQYIKEHYLELRHDYTLDFIFSDDSDSMFNRGRALIEGVKEAPLDTDVFIFADGDLWVPINKLHEAIHFALRPEVGYVVPFSSVAYLPKNQTDLVFGGALINRNCYGMTFWNQPSTGGLNVITPDKYKRSFGFDPRFRGWGFEDSAFDAQVQTLVGPCKWLDTKAYHLYHVSARLGNSPEHIYSNVLCDRYRKAMGNKSAMLEIINERK